MNINASSIHASLFSSNDYLQLIVASSYWSTFVGFQSTLEQSLLALIPRASEKEADWCWSPWKIMMD